MNKHVVCVHGLGNQTDGWSERWKTALVPQCPSIPADHWHEVVYADVLTAPVGLPNIGRAVSFDADALEDGEYNEVSDYQGLGSGWLTEVRKYFSNQTLRLAAIHRFLDVLVPLLEIEGTVYVIAHSWGTVVSYGGILTLSQTYPASIVYLTPGAALHMRVVRKRLRETNHFTPLPHVRRWINLQAQGDIVGGNLKSYGFPTTEEHLNLSIVEKGQPLKVIHESYFNPLNTNICRDIFGKTIEED